MNPNSWNSDNAGRQTEIGGAMAQHGRKQLYLEAHVIRKNDREDCTFALTHESHAIRAHQPVEVLFFQSLSSPRSPGPGQACL